MKDIKNFLIKREQSQARLSFAKREKSRLLAKTILTLVALLAVTTGAWADETPLVTINSIGYTTFTSGSKTFDDKVTVTFSNSVSNDGDHWGWYTDGTESLLTVAGINGYTITSCKFYTFDGTAKTGYTVAGESPSVYLSNDKVYTDANQSVDLGKFGISKIEVFGGVAAASSGPEVDGPTIVDGKPQWTFTMPGGNVTLEPEYYPQAALTAAPTAINNVPATTDGAIVSAGTVKNIGETTTAQGTVMYYVSKTEMTDAALLALAADQWTADVPTAAGLAQGPAYVYYYVRGNDSDNDEENFSDGDIKALQVTLGAAPLWNAEFDLTNAPEEDKAGKWSTDIPEGGVVKGTPVTVTYTGSKKVIGVKAEKKAKAAVPITVTWNNDDITGTGKSFTKDGVTITAGDIDFGDKNFTSGGTFSTTLGNFTKIEVTTDIWNASGTGWSGSGQSGTWTGTPASSVSFSGGIVGADAGNTKFVFTIEPTN